MKFSCRHVSRLASLTAFLVLVFLPHASRGMEITLPSDRGVYLSSHLPGYAATQTYCMTCHSTEYVQYQPASARAYWQATVVKMQKTFGAPIPDSEIPSIVDYLAKVYGTEKPAATTPTASAPPR